MVARTTIGLAVGADARIDDAEHDGVGGRVGDGVGEEDRAEHDVHRRNAMGQVHDAGVRSDPRDHAVTDADELVLETEIRQEQDRAGHWIGSCSTRRSLAHSSTSSARLIDGYSSNSGRNCHDVRANVVVGASALTVADRGWPSSSDISPK